MTKNVRTAILSITSVLILFGTLICVRFLPNKKEKNDSELNVSPITILDEPVDNIKRVEINNSYGKYQFVKNEENKLEIEDLIGNYKPNENAYEEFENLGLNLVAEKKIVKNEHVFRNTNKNIEEDEYGLGDYKACVTIQHNDETLTTLLIGHQAPGEVGYYSAQVGKPEIYLISNEVANLFFKSKIDYISLSVISPQPNKKSQKSESQNSQQPLPNLEYVEFFSGKKSEKIRIIKSNSTKNKNTYQLVEPIQATVLESNNYIIESVENISASRIETINATESDILDHGLNSPFAELKLKYKDQPEINLVLSQIQNSEDFFGMIKDSNIIYRISKYNLEWVDVLAEDLIK